MFNDRLTISVPNQNALSDQDFLLSLSEAKAAAAPAWEAGTEEGQLAVDVLENDTDLFVVATMAGTDASDIELHLHNDLLTIRGRRSLTVGEGAHFFYEENFWGPFSRTVVLPVDIDVNRVQSEYKNGVLTVRLPKARVNSSIPILVVEE